MAISPHHAALAEVVEQACQADRNIFGYGIWTHHILSVVEYGKQLAAILDADADIVERLLTVEQAYAEVHQQLAQLQFHLVELEHQQAEEQRQTRRQSKRKGEKTQTDDSTE